MPTHEIVGYIYIGTFMSMNLHTNEYMLKGSLVSSMPETKVPNYTFSQFMWTISG